MKEDFIRRVIGTVPTHEGGLYLEGNRYTHSENCNSHMYTLHENSNSPKYNDNQIYFLSGDSNFKMFKVIKSLSASYSRSTKQNDPNKLLNI